MQSIRDYFTEPEVLSSKAQMNRRFAVLVFASWLMIGSYYCYDNPSALHDQMQAEFSNLSDFDVWFNLLYTVYSIPNTVLPFFGGYFVDKFGARWMNVIFSSFIACGQLLFAVGSHLHSFPVMLAGRVLFGFGGESLGVGCSTVIAQWFKGRELALALGIQLSIARLGSVINDIVSPALVQATGSVPYTLDFGVIVCISSVISALFLVPIDKTADRKLEESGYKKRDGEALSEEEQVHFSDVKNFNLKFWLLTISCLVVYGCVLPFNNIASALIIQKFICHGECCPGEAKQTCAAQTNAESKASYIMGIPFIISFVLSPFLGGTIDKVGGRALFTFVSSGALIGVHSAIALYNGSVDQLYAPLIFQGIAYAVFAAALWPSVPYVVEAKSIGTAYGLMTAVQNAGLALFPVIVGAISNATGGYTDVEWFFVSLALAGFITAIALNINDYKTGNILNGSKSGRTDDSSTAFQPLPGDEEAGK